MAERFDSALNGLGEGLQNKLVALSPRIKQNIQEIRLREGLPLALTVSGETVFLNSKGQTVFTPDKDNIKATKSDIEECFKKLCNSSVFAHEEELKNGYIKLKNGNRAGVFGTLDAKGNMQNVTSINIRIARQIKGVAQSIACAFRGEGWLILGKPGSGKTTVLRDFIRLVSNGVTGKNYRVAVIDSRGELWGNGQNDLGACSDVLNCENKAKGIEIAIRTMFPEVIAFDEVGTYEELKQISEGFNAGVSVITTAHIEGREEIFNRRVTAELLNSGAISRVAVLSDTCGGSIKVYTLSELVNADF